MKRLVLIVVALAFVLAGCKVDATVTVDMHDDGSGRVTLDVHLAAQAVQALESGGTKLEDAVRLADLQGAGWTIGPWKKAADGSASLQLSKPFTSPDQVAGIVGELNGAGGPVRDVTASRDRGLLGTDYSVKGAVDLGAIATGITADPELVASLTNQQVDPNAIDQSLLQRLHEALSVDLVVKFPDGSSTTVTGVAGQRVPVDASANVRNTRRIVLFAVAIGLVVLAVVVWFGGRHSRRRVRAKAPIRRFDPHSRRT